MTQVKICGITNKEDALCAAELRRGGAGLYLLSAISPRYINPENARKIISVLPE